MAASNLLEKLDPALLRPGRFDRQVFVSPPDVGGRRAILDVHTRNKPLRDDLDLDTIAQQTSGLTGADLANICNEAAIRCVRRKGHALVDRGLRRGARARRRRRAVLDDAERPRARGRRLPRGRARADARAALDHRARAQDLDRPARAGARLRDEPARRGQLPEDARGADRPDDRAARRPLRRAGRLRRGHHRRRERPPARRRDHQRDGARLRHGHLGGRQPHVDRLRPAVGPDAPHPRRGAAGAGLRGPSPGDGPDHRPTARSSRSSRASCSRRKSSAAPTSTASWRASSRSTGARAAACASSRAIPPRLPRRRLRRGCSPASTTSASPSNRSTTR